MTFLPYGPNAWLVQVGETVGQDAFFRMRCIVAELEQHPPAGLIEFVPGLTTILLEFDPRQTGVERVVLPKWIAGLNFRRVAKVSTMPVKTIPVRYDGPDLNRVANLHGLTVPETIQLHTNPVYTVYMLGFSPGFPYLGDLDSRLHTPRLASPRSKVTAGAVAIGGEHTGIYTIGSPGGWNIIGHTSLKLFDPNQSDAQMFLLKPGDRVKFVSLD